ncbi:hypothetical protein EDB87DRAFT_1302271 [Lactarius vividus]|nr:hypothetical protein EDB87DRAFT_1302271 [Lactarius vividus]
MPHHSPSITLKPDLPTAQRLTPPSQVTSNSNHLTTDNAEASTATAAENVHLLLGSADEPRTFLPLERKSSATGAHSIGGRHSAGVCGAGGAGDAAVTKACFGAAEEKVGANLDVMKREARAAAGSSPEGTRNDVSDDLERHRRRRDLAFGRVFLSFGSHERRWEMTVGVIMNQLRFPVMCRRFYYCSTDSCELNFGFSRKIRLKNKSPTRRQLEAFGPVYPSVWALFICFVVAWLIMVT